MVNRSCCCLLVLDGAKDSPAARLSRLSTLLSPPVAPAEVHQRCAWFRARREIGPRSVVIPASGVATTVFFGRNVALGGVGVIFHNALQATELGAFIQADQGYPLRGASKFADFAHPRAHQHALVGD